MFPSSLSAFGQSWLRILLKLFWATYLGLTSLYCLLAYFPYTNCQVIKGPPYEWISEFARYHAVLYWAALAAAGLSYGPLRKTSLRTLVFAGLALIGIFITVWPLLTAIDNLPSYWISVASLFPVLLLAGPEAVAFLASSSREEALESLGYANVLIPALILGFLSLVGTRIRELGQTPSTTMHIGTIELGIWAVISHVVLAIVVVSALNLILVAVAKTAHPRRAWRITVFVLSLSALSITLQKFLADAFTFVGWRALLFAVLLASSVILIALSIGSELLFTINATEPRKRRMWLSFLAAGVCVIAVATPGLVGDKDWNNVFQNMIVFATWVGLIACAYSFRPQKKAFSAPATIAVLVVTIFSYKMLQATEIFWGRPLGRTDGDIAQSMEHYASENASFKIVHDLLGNAPAAEPCGDLCRILRQYTNVRDAHTTTQVNFVDHLSPSSGERPNIFILVIDSLRPDYLGAYNPKVDFTPNIDAFARESVVFHSAYTQYAGTSLSEPVIWSGSMLLHAHYLQPFENVNSLDKLLNEESYSKIVSFDVILQQILPGTDPKLIKLDTDKKVWTDFELCSTVPQLDRALDARSDKRNPVFFYSQPMNVHMFAHNQQPTLRDVSWSKPGFNTRVSFEVHQVDQCMGSFVSELKKRGLYDNSVIILTADHGDATGELGRRAHSHIIYPEVMRVPLIVHLPRSMRGKFMYDQDQIAALTDISPSLYYLLGYRNLNSNPMYGHSLFAESQTELESHRRRELFLASDEIAAYGILSDNGRYMYATYDSPARSFLFDLAQDPNALHSILTPELKRAYDVKIIDYLKMIGDFYGYRPGIEGLLATARN